MTLYTAASLARELRQAGDAKVTERMVHDYVRRRILPPADPKTNRYTDAHLQRLRAARALVRSGKSLDEVREQLNRMAPDELQALSGYLHATDPDLMLVSYRSQQEAIRAYTQPAQLPEGGLQDASWLRSAGMPQNFSAAVSMSAIGDDAASAASLGPGQTTAAPQGWPDRQSTADLPLSTPQPAPAPVVWTTFPFATPIMSGVELRTLKPLPPETQAVLRQVVAHLVKPHLS